MTLKPKSTPQNPLVYWWNEFLFARSFTYTTSLSPEECQKALYRLAGSGSGDWMSNVPTTTVDVEPTASGASQFEIRIKRNNWSAISYTMAKATGTIGVENAGRTTLVKGKARFGTAYYVITLLSVAIIAFVFFNFSGLIMDDFTVFLPAIASVVFAVLFWWQMYSDRNSLTVLIQEALEGAEVTLSEKMKREQSSASVDETPLTHNEQQSSRKQR